MAKCEKCGKTYYSKECINCKNDFNKKNNQTAIKKKKEKPKSEKDKLFKTIRYTIIFFISIFIISAIVEIYYINQINKEITPTLKQANKMSQKMMKETEKMMKKLNKGFEYKPPK